MTTSLALHLIGAIGSEGEYDRLLRQSKGNILPIRLDEEGPVATMKNCFPHQDDPVDVNVANGVVRYATMGDGSRQDAMVSLATSASGENVTVSLTPYQQYRSLCCVYLSPTGGYVKVSKTEPGANVWINGCQISSDGNYPIVSGCILSLKGKIGLALQVVIRHPLRETIATQDTPFVPNMNDEVNNKRRKVSAIDVRSIRDAARKSFIAESTCPVCYEVIIAALSPNVCNHKYCTKCITQIQDIAGTTYIKCPICRMFVSKWIHDPFMDNMIWAGALDGKFEGDLAREYLKRREKFQDEVATKEQTMCVLNIARGT